MKNSVVNTETSRGARWYIAIVLVIVCTVLLQVHSIPFWKEQTGDYMGYLWSVSIEGVGLWLWLNKKRFLATLASTIVILVPLMQLSKPILKEIRNIEKNIKIEKLNNFNLKQTELLQNKYLDTNWAGTLMKNTTHLRDAINSQKELLANKLKSKSIYENIFMIILESIALVLVLLTQIQVIKILVFQDSEKIETSENLEITEGKAEILLKKIENYMKTNSISQSQLALKLDINSSIISKLRNTVKASGEGLSHNKLDDLEGKFEKSVGLSSRLM